MNRRSQFRCQAKAIEESQRVAAGRGRRAASLIELLVVFAVIGLLTAILAPAVQASREAGRRASCANNLRQVGLAVLGYSAAAGGHLPALMDPLGLKLRVGWEAGPDGSAPIAWRYTLLPYLEERGIHDYLQGDLLSSLRLNGAETPANPLTVPTFECPSAPSGRVDISLSFAGAPGVGYDGVGVSDYAAISYVNDLVPGVLSRSGAFYGRVLIDLNIVNQQRERAALAMTTDGLSQTVMVGERTQLEGGMHGWITKWPYDNLTPVVEPINSKRQDLSLQSVHPGGAFVCLADGHVRFLDEATPADIYEAILTRDAGD